MRSATRMRLTLGLVGVALLGAGLGVWPRMHAIRSLQAQEARLRQRAAASDDGDAKLGRLQQELDKAAALAAQRSKPIPAQSHVAELIRALTAELDRLGMSQREITTGTPVQLPDAASLPMNVSMAGRFPSVHEAIRWIEGLPRLVRLKRVEIHTPRSKGGRKDVHWTAPIVEAELLLDVFFAPVGGSSAPEGVSTAAAQEDS